MSKLPVTEELDFAYLLELMPVLHNIPEFTWLPELFAIVGYERLIKLCKYAGGETITIPKLEDLADSIDALQWFYDVNFHRSKQVDEVPENIRDMYIKIVKAFNAS